MSLPIDFKVVSGGKTISLKNARELNLVTTYNERGDNTISFQLCDWANKIPDPRSRVFLIDPTYGVFWSGYFGKPRINIWGPVSCEGNGWQYSLRDDGWNEPKIFAAGTPLENLVFEAFSKASKITSGIPLPGGLETTQLPTDSQDFNQQTPEDLFDYVKGFFTFLDTPLVWQIKNNPLTPFADQPSLEMKFVDTTPRYRVRLRKDKDTFEPQYDADVIFNQGSVSYGNGLNEEYQDAVPYTYIPDLRRKRLNANNDVKDITSAQALVRYLVSRNNKLRPINTVLELDCNTPVTALYPATPAGTINNWPHHLIRPHFYIQIQNDMTSWGRYNVRDYYIVEVRHDWEKGTTNLTLGDPVYYEAIKLLNSYETNRSLSSVESSVVSEPLRNADEIPTYGPTSDGLLPSTTGEGIPIHYLDQSGTLVALNDVTKPSLPNGAAVHPNLIADYGVQVNFGREADTQGIKGHIRVIPCKILDWELAHTPPPNSTTIPTDGMTVRLYPTYPFIADTGYFAEILISSGQPTGAGVLGTPQVFAQGGKIGVHVSNPAATAGSGFQIGLGGKKLFPDLGLNT